MLTFPFFLLQILYISLLTSGASARGSSATAASIRPVIDHDDDHDGDAIVNMKQVIMIFGVVIYMLFNVIGKGVGRESLGVCLLFIVLNTNSVCDNRRKVHLFVVQTVVINPEMLYLLIFVIVCICLGLLLVFIQMYSRNKLSKDII